MSAVSDLWLTFLFFLRKLLCVIYGVWTTTDLFTVPTVKASFGVCSAACGVWLSANSLSLRPSAEF